MHQQHVTGQARRRRHPLDEIEQDVFRLGLVLIGQLTRIGHFVLEVNHAEGAVGLRLHPGHQTLEVAATVAGAVVPHHFDARLGNREGVIAAVAEAREAVATVHPFGVQRAGLGRSVDLIRQPRAAVGRVHRDLVAVRVALEHRQLAGGQLVFVLLGVGRGDGKQRLLVGEGVGQEAFAVHRAGVG
ncbi:hypothetical protein D3C84_647570 [compost metagenome]